MKIKDKLAMRVVKGYKKLENTVAVGYSPTVDK